jgi:hypothetical protein
MLKAQRLVGKSQQRRLKAKVPALHPMTTISKIRERLYVS